MLSLLLKIATMIFPLSPTRLLPLDLPSSVSLKFQLMIENVTPHSFECKEQLSDITQLLEVAHGVGLLSDEDNAHLLRQIEAKKADLAEGRAGPFGGDLPDWMRVEG
ncbi:hypothetical protein [Duganella levis]|uniref:Uncharacterized protein n=1 Tax=Duganella levis TaxID=2692169 RepID=A0ABW9VT71_9BURK|nr:hypothetical protein [Duganella levis]MYN24820.1 hypothetical protein [Duganella levis]